MNFFNLCIFSVLSSLTFAQSPGFVIPQEALKSNQSSYVLMANYLKVEQLFGMAPLTGLPIRSSEVFSISDIWADPGLEVMGSDALIRLHPLFGFEYRNVGQYEDNVQAMDGGLWLQGHKEMLSFYLDARIFTESRESDVKYSWDGEFIEIQSDNNALQSVNNNFTSFSRYRANIDYTSTFGSIGFRRDNLIWGPSQRYNLVFGPQAIPFSHLYYQMNIGSVRIQTIWGQVSIDGAGWFTTNEDTRSVYGHRYEWNPSSKWLLGLSEQTIVYNGEQFSALFPVVPLFMDKGQSLEEKNNGNIAADLTYTPFSQIMLFGEFLVDDLQEPSTLFDDFWGNRWAATMGARGAQRLSFANLYYNLEWARIEPWVYTHYNAGTSQSTHRGMPLGNVNGPNSEAVSFEMNLRKRFEWGVSMRIEALWKGETIGSDAEDPVTSKIGNKKHFLKNVDSPDWAIEPTLFYRWSYLTFETSGRIELDNDNTWWRTRIHAEF